MRTFNVRFLAVISCIAIMGATAATPIESGSPQQEAEDADLYIALQQLMEVLT